MPKRRVKRHLVTQPSDPSYRLIPLTRNQNALVDTVDFDWLMQWNWHAYWNPDVRSFYARRCEGELFIYMHREILGCLAMQGDHKNHDTLDNRRENIRKATSTQNHANQRINKANTSGFKGVSWNKHAHKWMAYIKIHRRRHYLGLFDSPKDAGLAYDIAAKKLFGTFAHLNFTYS